VAEVVRCSGANAEASARVERALRESLAARGQARLAVAGGSAAAALGSVRRALAGDWKRVRLTWVDERAVPFDSPDSNRGSAYRAGALASQDPPAVELPLFLDGESPEHAVARAERGLREQFASALDVLLLGMGEDGHVASLFPGHAALVAPGLVTSLADSPKPPPHRITLTLSALQAAPVAVLLVSGEAKRQALARLQAGDPTLPAALLTNLTVVTDLEER